MSGAQHSGLAEDVAVDGRHRVMVVEEWALLEVQHYVGGEPEIVGTRPDGHTGEPERSTVLDMARFEESLMARDV